MNSVWLVVALVAAMFSLMGFGIPVAGAMILVSVVGMICSVDLNYALSIMQTVPYNVASNYTFAAIPMFIFMGLIAGSTGIVRDIFQAANLWLASVRGGLYMATTISAAAFGAINGSTIVGSALFTRVALPEMVKLGYKKGTSAGCIVGAGTFAAMIPPSITIVLYGILTAESIGQLLIAGILPGVLTGVVYLIGIAGLVRLRPSWAPPANRSPHLSDKLRSLGGVLPILCVSAVMVGGIYTGIVSPSAAGAIGSAAVLLIGLALRRLDWRQTSSNLSEAAKITASLFFVIMGGIAFSRLLLVTGFVDGLLDGLDALKLEPWMVIGLIILMYLVLGMLMDAISMMVMTVPIVHPLVVGLGYDPIWFAIIMVKLIELACMTPPIGINLFAVAAASEGTVSIREIYSGVLPFVLLEVGILSFLLLNPGFVTMLPHAMLD
ncbi:TRAP transporter large permease [Roseovarius sp.]|uniref:TRAP transporter large permease n=1 Tax=Roseovarius sp. TaxID=1486281 RepID=UPI003B5BD504